MSDPTTSDLKHTEAVQNRFSTAVVNENGRVEIEFDEKALPELYLPTLPPSYTTEVVAISKGFSGSLNILIQIVGSRGDVQPFIALGQELRTHGHRVRIATHDTFRNFVAESGLEFFPIGGDPAELMSYMVKNPGIIPKLSTITAGDISRKRRTIREMLQGCWRSCIDPDPQDEAQVPFIAEVIVANPPAFAHVHCAQALSIPLHIMFTMPWTPTRAFPHPLANIRNSTSDPRLLNLLSYGIIEFMTWQGLGDVINNWRKDDLDLDPIPYTIGPDIIQHLKVPHTYCWSPALVPKPDDWPVHVDVCGFFFREPPLYTPPAEIENFLKKGPTPVYIGFGSIVMDDPRAMTDMILDAVAKCGTRAIVSQGWSKLGDDREHENVLFIGDCPHEWLFQHVSAVVHHGGAGTTACGLANGRPTAIVPFFGDQPFWGAMVATAGAGPPPIHHKSLTAGSLTAALQTCLSESCLHAANEIALSIRSEDGVRRAVDSFHRNLDAEKMSCDLLPSQIAVWKYRHRKRGTMKLSAKAVGILLGAELIKVKDLKQYRTNDIHIDRERTDPLTATSSVLLGTVIDFSSGFGSLLTAPVKGAMPATRSDTQKSGAARVGDAAGKGLGKMVTTLPKAMLVDFPMALTDGLNGVPGLYGQKVGKLERIDDAKSGSVAAGKNFVKGFGYGLSELVTLPYKGARDEGFGGFAKGLAMGTAGLVAKPGAALFGLFAYPIFGIYKSLSAALSRTQKEVLKARLAHDDYMASRYPVEKEEIDYVIKEFGTEKKPKPLKVQKGQAHDDTADDKQSTFSKS